MHPSKIQKLCVKHECEREGVREHEEGYQISHLEQQKSDINKFLEENTNKTKLKKKKRTTKQMKL